MLTTQDKRWIAGTIHSALKEALKDMVTKEELRQTLDARLTVALDAQTREICAAMAEGFAECVSIDRFAKLEERFTHLEQKVNGLEGHMDSRFKYIEDNMVTFDYLDKRLGELKSRLWEEPIKQLKSVDVAVLNELKRNKVINPKRANVIASLPPYPQKLASA